MILEIFKVFAEESAAIEVACGPGCATCCTRNVTLTTAEGRLITEFLRDNGRRLPQLPRDQIPLRPVLTTNEMTGRYLTGREVVEEAEYPWLFEPCFFLREGLCEIYEVRPFACRCFVSTVNCEKTGMAEVPERLVTLTIITNQLLEDNDRGGWWGNLADIMAFLDGWTDEDDKLAARDKLLPNQPTPGLLVIPEERGLVKNYLVRLGKATGLDFDGLLFR